MMEKSSQYLNILIEGWCKVTENVSTDTSAEQEELANAGELRTVNNHMICFSVWVIFTFQNEHRLGVGPVIFAT